MTRSPSSIIAKSAIACPTSRRSRLRSLLASNSARRSSRAAGTERVAADWAMSIGALRSRGLRLLRRHREHDPRDAAGDDLEADQVADQDERPDRPADH